MTSVRKSPNMMSTTGRSPVIAAPIPRPVMPGSEIGESSTRSVPNSSTRPASTLKGVPASATSSPITKTASSRRSSSVRASLIACALDEVGGVRVDSTRVLTVDFARFDPERARPREDVARRDVEVVGVLVVLVVLADVDHWQPPERGHVHHLVDEPLAERALSEEAHRDLVAAAPFCRERGAGRDPGGAADDRVRAEIAVLVIGDVHRAALPTAVTRLLAEQLGEHAAHLRTLGETVTVAAVRGRDPVLAAEGCAHADRDRLLADVEMCETGHLRASIQLVRLLLEQADQGHAAIHLERAVRADLRVGSRCGHATTSVFTPDIDASTSKSAAKSFSPTPIAFAAVRNSFVTAVVGSGTSTSRPSSSARFMSFCIMRQSNHASSGCSSANGPR